jgi:glycerol-3-phosphate cytidylyltransferase
MSKKESHLFFSYEERAEIVSACGCVDLVIPEKCWQQKAKDIEKYNVDVFAMGDDWQGKFDFLSEHCEVIYLPRTEDISTTEIKNALAKVSKSDLKTVEETLHDALALVSALSNSLK